MEEMGLDTPIFLVSLSGNIFEVALVESSVPKVSSPLLAEKLRILRPTGSVILRETVQEVRDEKSWRKKREKLADETKGSRAIRGQSSLFFSKWFFSVILSRPPILAKLWKKVFQVIKSNWLASAEKMPTSPDWILFDLEEILEILPNFGPVQCGANDSRFQTRSFPD